MKLAGSLKMELVSTRRSIYMYVNSNVEMSARVVYNHKADKPCN